MRREPARDAAHAARPRRRRPAKATPRDPRPGPRLDPGEAADRLRAAPRSLPARRRRRRRRLRPLGVRGRRAGARGARPDGRPGAGSSRRARRSLRRRRGAVAGRAAEAVDGPGPSPSASSATTPAPRAVERAGACAREPVGVDLSTSRAIDAVWRHDRRPASARLLGPPTPRRASLLDRLAGRPLRCRRRASARSPPTIGGEPRRAIARVLDYIRAGDVYQVNLSHRLHGAGERDGLPLYRALRALAPPRRSAPYLETDARDARVQLAGALPAARGRRARRDPADQGHAARGGHRPTTRALAARAARPREGRAPSTS